MFGKSRHVAVTLLVVLAAALMVPESAFAISGPPPPSVSLEFERGWAAAPKCPAEYTIKLRPEDGFQGAVNLTLANPPKGVTADIYPNPVLLSYWNWAGIIFPMRVDVSPDTPNGTYQVKVIATALPGPGSILYNEVFNNKTATQFDGYFTLVVGKCGEPLPDATTTTSTTPSSTISVTTTTVTTTVTTTLPNTLTGTITAVPTATAQEGTTDPTAYGWAISATVATVVLAVTLLMQRRTKQ